MASTQNVFWPSTFNPTCDDQTTKSRTKSVNMSTTTTITEQASVSTHLPILTLPPALLGLYRERYGPQSAVASCNPSDISTPHSLDFSLQTRFTLIHLASQRCTLDCRDHPGGPLIRRGDVPTLDQPCASTCRPGPHNHPAPAHQKYLTIAHVLSKKTFQTLKPYLPRSPWTASTWSSPRNGLVTCMRSHRVYDGPETRLPADAGIVLLLEEPFLSVLMVQTRQLKSDIESGSVPDEVVKSRWEAMDCELVRMNPTYLSYHVGVGNSQVRFHCHRARTLINTGLNYILPTSMVYKYHFVYERMFPPLSLPAQEYVTPDAGERGRFKRLNDLHNEWYLLFRYILQSSGGSSGNPPMNPNRPMEMLVPQEDEGISADDGFRTIRYQRQRGHDRSGSGEGNSGGFGRRQWDGGTSRNTEAEVERKVPEVQSHAGEIAFDEQFMRGLLEWKNNLSESMILAYATCGSNEEGYGAESGDEDGEWTGDGDVEQGRQWIENYAVDRVGAVEAWLQETDENSCTSFAVEV